MLILRGASASLFLLFLFPMFSYLSLFLGFFYMVLGVFIIIYKFFVVMLEPMVAYALGALMIVYGISRIYRAINKIKEDRNV